MGLPPASPFEENGSAVFEHRPEWRDEQGRISWGPSDYARRTSAALTLLAKLREWGMTVTLVSKTDTFFLTGDNWSVEVDLPVTSDSMTLPAIRVVAGTMATAICYAVPIASGAFKGHCERCLHGISDHAKHPCGKCSCAMYEETVTVESISG